jgi:hypothetical protein
MYYFPRTEVGTVTALHYYTECSVKCCTLRNFVSKSHHSVMNHVCTIFVANVIEMCPKYCMSHVLKTILLGIVLNKAKYFSFIYHVCCHQQE